MPNIAETYPTVSPKEDMANRRALLISMFRSIIQEVRYKDWLISFAKWTDAGYYSLGALVIYRYRIQDNITGEKQTLAFTREIPMSIENERDFLDFVFSQIKYLECHEAAEIFKYRDERTFWPHRPNGHLNDLRAMPFDRMTLSYKERHEQTK